MSLTARNELIFFGMLLTAAVIGELLVHRRVHWKTLLLLMAAGVASSVLSVVIYYGPIQRALLPVRFEPLQDEEYVPPPGQNLPLLEHDVPPPIAWVARQGRLPAGFERQNLMGPGWFDTPISIDPNPVCALPPRSLPADSMSTGPPPVPDPSRLVTYRGWRAFVFYAFGNHVANAVQHGAYRCFYHGIMCAIVLLVCRRGCGGLSAADRASVLVRSAWFSIGWPALAAYSHALFWAIYMAWSYDVVRLGTGGLDLPLAVGGFGVGAIWLGAALGHIATIAAVARHAALRNSEMDDGGGRDKDSGTVSAVVSGRGLDRSRAHLLFAIVKWLVVAGLLCAPITLPLVGALLPQPVVDWLGQLWSMAH